MNKAKKTVETALADALKDQKDENKRLLIELSLAHKELAYQKEEKGKRTEELGIANKELVFQGSEKEKRAVELGIAKIELAFQDQEKGKRAVELGIANRELAFQDGEKEKRALELGIANKELAFQDGEKEKRAAELVVANEEKVYQNEEKEKRAAELGIADKELVFQNDEKEKRAAELIIANKELVFQNKEKEKRAAELAIANEELVFQNTEKEKRAAELIIANKELVFQNDEKEKRAAELIIANKELIFQNQEKEKRAAELIIANNELAFQNDEKEKRAAELNTANKELAFQNEEKEKRASEKEKRAAELIIANKELIFQNGEKEKRAAELEEKNKEVEAAKSDIERKTRQLEVSSKYKSEFLANMSHELRTPLNSLLILSKDLSENRKKNLDDEQVECAEIIYKSGHDLLVLINEVLDLSKIEAGKMTINVEKVFLKLFLDDLARVFKPNAEIKGLRLETSLADDLPEYILSDSQRLKQILKNLISNAIKFTDQGTVRVALQRHSKDAIIVSVSDTGIGIQEGKQLAIFEAFQQADGTTSRKYGGTGLGLSISRELAKLLGAKIHLSSRINEGATFSVVVPLKISAENEEELEKESFMAVPHPGALPENDVNYINYPTIRDDRNSVGPTDKVVLIIEDDLKFADVLLKLAHQKGFKCLSAATGEDGFLMAKQYHPQAIILDLGLPGIKGHELLLELKADPNTSHIPVHIISGKERSREALQAGAIEYLMKPVAKRDMEETFERIEKLINNEIKNLLIIEDDENSRKAIRILIGNDKVNYFEARTGMEALKIYRQYDIDCIILDVGLPDMNGFDFIHQLEHLDENRRPPIIIYTGMDLTKDEKNELKKYAKSIISKGVQSEVLLLKETALFLHRTKSHLKASVSSNVEIHVRNEVPKILLVDDDYRNVFALSKILTGRGMEVIKAENGLQALKMLESNPGIDLVLMDIMMPEMDGYQAMRLIRAQSKFIKLPVIAVTAKAMNYDKQKCIVAGANGYITKPVDTDNLFEMIGKLLGDRYENITSAESSTNVI
jgi:CheY-like chemotaxis protein/signal transduction histidine kinase